MHNFEHFRQDTVEGPCRNWYNQSFLESLNQPRAIPSDITSNRVANQENRRRPSRPALPRRQNVVQERLPAEPIPQQLADLERFGQPKGKEDIFITNVNVSFSVNREPSFGQNFQEPTVTNQVAQTGLIESHWAVVV